MTKNLKLLAFVIVFLAQCSIMWAQDTEDREIFLSSRSITPKINGTMGPTRAPGLAGLVPFTVNAYINDDNSMLTLTDTVNETFNYYICDEFGAVYTSGVLNFNLSKTLYLDIDYLQGGLYYIVLEGSNVTIVGTLNL